MGLNLPRPSLEEERKGKRKRREEKRRKKTPANRYVERRKIHRKAELCRKRKAVKEEKRTL